MKKLIFRLALSFFAVHLLNFQPLFAQFGNSMPFKDYIEITDYLDEDDKKILRENKDLMNSEIYFSIDEAKRGITSNVKALSIDYYKANITTGYDVQNFINKLNETAFFPNLVFLHCSVYFPEISTSNKIKYFFLTNMSDTKYYEAILNATLLCVNNWNAKELPLRNLEKLRKLSYRNGMLRNEDLTTFVNYPRLEILDIVDNKIKSPPSNWIIPPQIKKLNLTGNKIGRTETLNLEFITLKSLNISKNEIKWINMVNLPELEELDLSDNLFATFPGSVIQAIPKLKVLNMSNNRNIGTFADYAALGFLDSLDVSLTKINFTPAELLNLRLALPNTTLVFSLKLKMNKVVSGKIEPEKLEELKALKTGWDNGDFNSSVKLGKYFVDKGDLALGDFVFTKLINNYPEKDFKTTLAIATYLDERKLPTLSDPLFFRLVNNYANPGFKSCFTLTRKMYSQHFNLARETLPRIMNHDSLDFFLNNRMFRIEYASLLYNCGFTVEADQQFDVVLDEIDLGNDKEVHEMAMYYDENNCHKFAIRLYEKMIESPMIVNEEKKLFASLSIADIYSKNKDLSAGYPFVHYEGVCFKDFTGDKSKAIVLQSCNKAWDAYQDHILVLMDEHKQNLMKMKKKVTQASNARNVGAFASMLGEVATVIPGAGDLAPLFDATNMITNDVTGMIANQHDAAANVLSNNAFTVEEKIAFIQSKQALVGDRINELDASNAILAEKEQQVPKVEIDKAKFKEKTANILNVTDDFSYLSMSSYNMFKGDYSKTFQNLQKAFKNNQIPFELKFEPYLKYYSYELASNKSLTNSTVLAEALLSAHPDVPQVLSLYSDIQISTGNFESAIQNLEKARSIEQNNYQIIEKLMFLYSEIGEWVQLNEIGHEAVTNYGNLILPHFFLGIAVFNLNNYEEAILELEKCLSLIKSDSDIKSYALTILGRSYAETGSYEKAESCFIQAMTISPNDQRVQKHYCMSLLKQPERVTEALEIAKHLVDGDVGNLDNCDMYAYALFIVGNYNEAKTWSLKAINNNNNTDGLAYEHHGDILYQLGNSSQALVYWNIAKSKGGRVTPNLDRKIVERNYFE